MIAVVEITGVTVGSSGVREYTGVTPYGAEYSPMIPVGGAGLALSYDSTPYTVGSRVLVGCPRGEGRPPYFIIGGVMNYSAAKALNDATEIEEGEVRGITSKDRAIRNSSSAVIVSPSKVTVSSPSINLQLRSGLLRVSQEGTSENQLLNAQATIDTLLDYIGKANATILAMQAVLAQVSASVAPTLTPPQLEALTASNTILANATAALPTVPMVSSSLDAAINPNITVP